MFDQLDDPEGFAPSDTFRAGVRRRTQQLVRRRRAGRVALVGALPVLGLAAVAVGLDRRLDSVQRVEIGEHGSDPLESGRPVTLLVLGTDSAPNDPQRARTTRISSDVILVVRVDRGVVSMLPIPRDLWTGAGKVSALSPADLTAWLADHLGIAIDHLVSMNMEAFAELADQVQPRVRVDLPIRDRNTGLALPVGCQTLDGEQALAYVRARHLQDLPGDPRSWRNDPTGNVGRVVRTQAMITAAWAQLDRLDASDLPALVDLLVDHATLDSGLSTTDLLGLVRLVRSASAPPTTATLPTSMASVPVDSSIPGATGAVSVLSLVPEDPRTDEVLVAFGGRLAPDTPALPAPAPDLQELIPPASAALGVVAPC